MTSSFLISATLTIHHTQATVDFCPLKENMTHNYHSMKLLQRFKGLCLNMAYT